MPEWLWKIDVYTYAWLRNWLSDPNPEAGQIFGEIFTFLPFAAAVIVSIGIKNERSLTRIVFFSLCAGIISFQISSILAMFINRPSPLALQNRVDGSPYLIAAADSFSFPDWGASAFAGILLFLMLSSGPLKTTSKITAATIFLFFVLYRVASGIAFPSDILVGTAIGALVGLIMAMLSMKLGRMSR